MANRRLRHSDAETLRLAYELGVIAHRFFCGRHGHTRHVRFIRAAVAGSVASRPPSRSVPGTSDPDRTRRTVRVCVARAASGGRREWRGVAPTENASGPFTHLPRPLTRRVALSRSHLWRILI